MSALSGRLGAIVAAARRRFSATRRSAWLLPFWAAVWACEGRLDQRLVQRRMARLIAASGCFDADFYVAAYPEVAADGTDPVWDYVNIGHRKARNPRPDFDSAYYLAMNPDVAAQRIDPFVHFILYGEAERRRTTSPIANAGAVGALEAPVDGQAVAELETRADTAVVVHLFYPDLWLELRSFVRSVEGGCDLYVSVPSDAAFRSMAGTILASFPGAVIRVVPNRGRDIAPFVAFLPALAGYRYACKIHTKKSLHRRDGREWRVEMLRELLGSPEHVRRIKALFDANPKLGLIGPSGFRARHDDFWEPNLPHLGALCRALGIALADLPVDFFGGSMFWFRPAALAPLARLELSLDAFERETGQHNATMAHALERIFNTVVRVAGLRVVDTAAVDLSVDLLAEAGASRIKLVALYHSEFHWDRDPGRKTMRRADPWAEVAQARPLFDGHQQPRLPSELGFYDLGVPEVRAAQAALAASHGVHGFCYRYEWFNGAARHARPLDAMIASGTSDFPFCLVWVCDAGRGDLAPNYATALIADVIPALRDRRYVRWNGRPVLLVEGIAGLPALEKAVAAWRECSRTAGVGEIHVCALSGVDESDPARIEALAAAADFDAVVALPPFDASLHDAAGELAGRAPPFKGPVHDYAAIVARDLVRGHAPGGLRRHRGLVTGRDDSPRGGKGPVVHGASPAEYGRWLEAVIEQERAAEPAGDVLVFVASWNDWTRGAVLEPDAVNGRGFLAATAAALGKTPRRTGTRVRAVRSDVSPGAPLR